jgi:sugar phosphate isomerase/epimerase
LQIGVFNDGLAHLSREQAFAWCAERGIERIEMGVGGWAQASHQLDLDALLREPAARDRLAGELRDHGLTLSCVNAAGNPLHPDPAVGDAHAARVRGAVELAGLLGVACVVTMSGCPGSRDGGRTPVFAPWALTPDDESLWEWQLEHRLAPFWRDLCARTAQEAPGVRICLELHPGASAYNPASFLRLAAAAGPNLGVNFDPSHFWWQGIDPACVISELGDRIGFAHGKDTLVHADRVRRNGVIDHRHPVDPDMATWHFAAVGTGHPVALWADLIAALRAAGYDGDLSIEHEDPRVGAEEGIETSLAALRAALAAAEAPVG